jgi:hypothetical protein
MAGGNVLMYFPWSRPDEEGAPLGNLNNRFGEPLGIMRVLARVRGGSEIQKRRSAADEQQPGNARRR